MSKKIKAKVLGGFVLEPGKDASPGDTVELTEREFRNYERRGKVAEAGSKEAKNTDKESKK